MYYNVYLAGKFEDVELRGSSYLTASNWRDDIVTFSVIYNRNDHFDLSECLEWDIVKDGISDGINYSGPIFLGEHNVPMEDHGYDGFLDNQREQVFTLCKKAIDKSDILFAWINSSDCHGTLCEIGYAYEKVKHLIVIYRNEALKNEVWFASQFANLSFICESPKEAFWKAMRQIGVLSEYIYVAWEKGTSHYKIGRTNDPDKRIKQLNSGTKRASQVEMIKVLAVQDSNVAEDLLHGKFADKNIRGEWFDLHPHDVKYLLDLENVFNEGDGSRFMLRSEKYFVSFRKSGVLEYIGFLFRQHNSKFCLKVYNCLQDWSKIRDENWGETVFNDLEKDYITREFLIERFNAHCFTEKGDLIMNLNASEVSSFIVEQFLIGNGEYLGGWKAGVSCFYPDICWENDYDFYKSSSFFNCTLESLKTLFPEERSAAVL